MIELQRSPIVRDVRSAFQVAMEDRFIEVVERLSGRKVVMFTSDSHVGPDLEVELFLLAGDDSPVPPRLEFCGHTRINQPGTPAASE